jgi:hypothetical protein
MFCRRAYAHETLRELGLRKESHTQPDMKRRKQKAKQPLHRAPKKPLPLLSFRLAEFSPKRFRVVLCLAYFLSSTLIIAAAIGDLWLDEIWSIQFARAAGSPIDILTRFHHDNNHVLNTLFLWLVGDQNTLFLYRVFAVVSGIVALLLVGHLARDWGPAEALLVVVLTGTSYPLVVYFSEARGYAPAIMFALLSYALLRRNFREFSPYRLIAFWAASILGILSHLSFVMVSTALLLFSLVNAIRIEGPYRTRLIDLLAHHVPPLAFLGWFYLFFARHMVLGGAPPTTNWDMMMQAATLLFGFPENVFFGGLGVLCVMAVLVAGSYTLYRNRNEEWLFFCFVLIVAPMLMLIFARPEHVYVRYFIVCFPFFYLLLSYLLCHGYRVSKAVRVGVIAAVLLMLSGQTHKLVSLLELGRGSYRAALTRILESSPEGVVRIGSDHDFRNRVLVDFYAPSLARSHTLRYIPQTDWHHEPPDWILTHSGEVSYQPSPDIAVPGVGVYHFFSAYRFFGLSGWNWFLYRRTH